ncbi:phospholipase D family protein [Micromonospora sp. 4G57]|uniref:Phospholipase D family protein n=1 Tax=Micromonospora sicca TaxID=2202420 RepID=A0ABU5JK74_9ACTN|nr:MULTISPECIES: phospholipase D family protein [unclassified Micromonospora]MDZ5446069.1 phospholipase D family protein [Micromonospora sp. 4G57]MDZ5492798.1 phospholipase D family protein [Micromonospora sp. 4G53]
MLTPDSRALLLDALRPPPGARLSRAVALTFTLDLESLLVAPLAFAAHGLRESTDPIAVMEGVRHCADRIDVFCQAGQIVVPPGRSALLAFVEPMVHQVRRPKPGHLFHPKLWALRFLDEATGETSLRMLVLSRNLTKDRSWDVCLRLDGHTGTRRLATNKPLFDLVQHTLHLAVAPMPPDRRAAIEALGEDLRRTEWEYPEGAREMFFYALGVPRTRPPDFEGTRHLVISPFCTAGGLERCAPSGKLSLVSRQETLDCVPQESLGGSETFVVSALAGLPAEEAPSGQEVLHGLHAKVYVVEKGHQARVLLGSANATDAAFGGNVELLVELVGSRTQWGVNALLGPGAGFREILEPYERQEATEPEPETGILRDLVRDIAAIPLSATVTPKADGYGIRLTSEDALPDVSGVRITAQLHTRRGEAVLLVPGQPVAAAFIGLALADITPFVLVIAEDGTGREQTVVLATLIGDPANRLDHLIAQQIDTPEKFLQFLLLMLGLGTEAAAVASDHAGGQGAWRTGGTGILELLLNALVDRPEQLDDLARLVTRIEAGGDGKRLLPPGFPELWRVITAARDTMTEAASR